MNNKQYLEFLDFALELRHRVYLDDMTYLNVLAILYNDLEMNDDLKFKDGKYSLKEDWRSFIFGNSVYFRNEEDALLFRMKL